MKTDVIPALYNEQKFSDQCPQNEQHNRRFSVSLPYQIISEDENDMRWVHGADTAGANQAIKCENNDQCPVYFHDQFNCSTEWMEKISLPMENVVTVYEDWFLYSHSLQ